MPKVVLAINNYPLINLSYNKRYYKVDLKLYIKFKNVFFKKFTYEYSIPYEQREPFKYTIYEIPFKLFYGKYKIIIILHAEGFVHDEYVLPAIYILKPKNIIVLELVNERFYMHRDFSVVMEDRIAKNIAYYTQFEELELR